MFIEKLENDEPVSLEDIPALIEEYKQAIAEKDKAYQQLMEKAVRFAKWIMYTDDSLEMRQQAQAFLKERKDGQKHSNPPQDPINR